jgi:hypothetical protein
VNRVLSQDELRAGIARLALVLGGLVVAALVLSLLFGLGGRSASDALAAGIGIVGVVLVVVGLGASFKASPLSTTRTPGGGRERASSDARRDAERLAFGLFALGIVFSLVALALG